MSDFGRDIASAAAAMGLRVLLLVFVAGAVTSVSAVYLVGWLLSHIAWVP